MSKRPHAPSSPEERVSDSPRVHNAPTERTGGRNHEVGQSVMRATLALLESEGVASVTFARVAVESGVNRTTLYRRWGSRSRLLAWALLERQTEVLPAVDLGTVEDDLVALMLALDAQLKTPLGRRFLEVSSAAPFEEPAVAEAFELFWRGRAEDVARLVVRGIARGELRADIDVPFLLEQVFGAYHFRLVRGMAEALTEAEARRYVRYALLPART